jgi:hypothetical protein
MDALLIGSSYGQTCLGIDMSHAEFISLIVTPWAIWYARRKAIHEDEFLSPMTTHMFVRRSVSGLNETRPSADS